jgi:putative hydrolase of the HAD superfamily
MGHRSDWVIVDYGGVIEGAPAAVFDLELATALEVGVESLRSAMAHHSPQNNRGELSDEAFWTDVARRLGRDVGLDLIQRYIQDIDGRFGVNRELIGALPDLSARGIRLAILSNATREWATHIRAIAASTFERVFISSEIGCAKPDLGCYELVDSELRPLRCVFIDDSERNLSPAAQVGWVPIHYGQGGNVHQLMKDVGRVFD